MCGKELWDFLKTQALKDQQQQQETEAKNEEIQELQNQLFIQSRTVTTFSEQNWHLRKTLDTITVRVEELETININSDRKFSILEAQRGKMQQENQALKDTLDVEYSNTEKLKAINERQSRGFENLAHFLTKAHLNPKEESEDMIDEIKKYFFSEQQPENSIRLGYDAQSEVGYLDRFDHKS